MQIISTKGQIDEERYLKGLEAKELFVKFYNAERSKVMIEKSVSSKVFNMPECPQEIHQTWRLGIQ